MESSNGLSRPKRVVFLVCKAGGGHISAARALTEAMQRYPQYEVKTVFIEDLIGPLGKILGEGYSAFYNWALRSGHYHLEPLIFRLLTFSTRVLHFLGIRPLSRFLDEFSPDLWVTLVHGAHDALNEAMRSYRDIPHFTVVTDAVTLRPSWLSKHCDLTFVSTLKAKQACLAAGLNESQVRWVGHPISPEFEGLSAPIAEDYESWGLDLDLPTVMLIMGGEGDRQMLCYYQQIIEANLPVQVVACCGHNTALKGSLMGLKSPWPMVILGYTDKIPQLMNLADVVVTKPGPGTLMEAIAAGVPLLVDQTRYEMFQERGNAAFIQENHLGEVMKKRSEFLPLLQGILFDAQKRALFQRAMLSHQKSRAVWEIVDEIDAALGQEQASMALSL